MPGKPGASETPRHLDRTDATLSFMANKGPFGGLPKSYSLRHAEWKPPATLIVSNCGQPRLGQMKLLLSFAAASWLLGEASE